MAGARRRWVIENSPSNSSSSSCRFSGSSMVISRIEAMLSATFMPRKIEASCGRYPMPSRARRYIGNQVTS